MKLERMFLVEGTAGPRCHVSCLCAAFSGTTFLKHQGPDVVTAPEPARRGKTWRSMQECTPAWLGRWQGVPDTEVVRFVFGAGRGEDQRDLEDVCLAKERTQEGGAGGAGARPRVGGGAHTSWARPHCVLCSSHHDSPPWSPCVPQGGPPA